MDDGSTDKSWEIIKGYGDLIIPISPDKNFGVSRASNEGIFCSKGDLIARVDGDDYINRNFIKHHEILRWNKDIGFVY